MSEGAEVGVDPPEFEFDFAAKGAVNGAVNGVFNGAVKGADRGGVAMALRKSVYAVGGVIGVLMPSSSLMKSA